MKRPRYALSSVVESSDPCEGETGEIDLSSPRGGQKRMRCSSMMAPPTTSSLLDDDRLPPPSFDPWISTTTNEDIAWFDDIGTSSVDHHDDQNGVHGQHMNHHDGQNGVHGQHDGQNMNHHDGQNMNQHDGQNMNQHDRHGQQDAQNDVPGHTSQNGVQNHMLAHSGAVHAHSGSEYSSYVQGIDAAQSNSSPPRSQSRTYAQYNTSSNVTHAVKSHLSTTPSKSITRDTLQPTELHSLNVENTNHPAVRFQKLSQHSTLNLSQKLNTTLNHLFDSPLTPPTSITLGYSSTPRHSVNASHPHTPKKDINNPSNQTQDSSALLFTPYSPRTRRNERYQQESQKHSDEEPHFPIEMSLQSHFQDSTTLKSPVSTITELSDSKFATSVPCSSPISTSAGSCSTTDSHDSGFADESDHFEEVVELKRTRKTRSSLKSPQKLSASNRVAQHSKSSPLKLSLHSLRKRALLKLADEKYTDPYIFIWRPKKVVRLTVDNPQGGRLERATAVLNFRLHESNEWIVSSFSSEFCDSRNVSVSSQGVTTSIQVDGKMKPKDMSNSVRKKHIIFRLQVCLEFTTFVGKEYVIVNLPFKIDNNKSYQSKSKIVRIQEIQISSQSNEYICPQFEFEKFDYDAFTHIGVRQNDPALMDSNDPELSVGALNREIGTFLEIKSDKL